MEKNIYLIDSRSTEQQAVIGNFVKTTILNNIVKKTYSLWNNGAPDKPCGELCRC